MASEMRFLGWQYSDLWLARLSQSAQIMQFGHFVARLKASSLIMSHLLINISYLYTRWAWLKRNLDVFIAATNVVPGAGFHT